MCGSRIFLDRVLLVVSAFLVGTVLLTVMIAADRSSLTRGWVFFIGGGLTYSATTLYLLWGTTLKRLAVRDKALAIVIAGLPVLFFFMLFYLEIVPLPESMFFYWLGTILIAPPIVVGVELLFGIDLEG